MNLELEWTSLERRAISRGGLAVRRVCPDSSQDLFVGLELERRARVVILEVDDAALPNRLRLESAKGIRGYMAATPVGRLSLCLELVLPDFTDVFTNLAQDIIDRVSAETSQEAAVRVFVERFKQWKVLLGHERPQRLSLEKQLGLFGELHVLSAHAIPRLGAVSAVTAWKGPMRAAHDFQFGASSVEAKVFGASDDPPSVRVSSEMQLDLSPGRRLLLWVIEADLDGLREGKTLPEMVDAVREVCGRDTPAGSILEQGLVASGYFDAHQDYYGVSMAVVDERVYEVRPGFPRLVPEALPPGVHAVSYELLLDACSGYRLDLTEAVRSIACTPVQEEDD